MAVEKQPLKAEEIEERLRAFEHEFQQPSEEFLLAFRNGRLTETDEFREWSILITARRLLVAD